MEVSLNVDFGAILSSIVNGGGNSGAMWVDAFTSQQARQHAPHNPKLPTPAILSATRCPSAKSSSPW